jgi:hypothetical protein
VTPSAFSEYKERDVVLVLHHRHVGVMNARSCAKRMHAAFFSGARFSHGVFNGDRRPVLVMNRLLFMMITMNDAIFDYS